MLMMTYENLHSTIILPECKKYGCSDKSYKRELCETHYHQRLALLVKMQKQGCSVKGCNNRHRANGLCSNHYNRAWQKRNPRHKES